MAVLSGLWNKFKESDKEELIRKLVIGFFVIYFIAGAFIVKDYGASSDENFERMTAQFNLDYITGKNTDLLTYSDRHYGVLFTLPLELASPLFPDSRDYFFFRHFATFLFFYLSTIVFYKLLRSLGFKRLLSLVGTIFLVLQPTIFAHSFFNLKDIPFLSVFIVSLYTLAQFIKTGSYKAAVIHGVVTGILIVFRLPGVLMWGITALMFGWLYVVRTLNGKQFASKVGVFLLSSFGSLYLFLPILWRNPLREMATYLSMSPFEWNNEELFMGNFYTLANLPLSHIFVYFGISMPLVLLFLFVVALVIFFKELLVDQKLFHADKYRMVLALIALSVTAEIFLVLRPAVYNGWRHLFFAYPIFLLFVIEAIEWLWNGNLKINLSWIELSRWLRISLAALITGQILLLLVFNAQSHPYQFTYYNWLAGRKLSYARQNYVMDYWGLSYRQAFEKILAADDSAKVIVRVDDIVPASINLLLLEPAQRERIQLVEMGSQKRVDYMVMIYKNNLYLDRKGYELIDSIYVRGAIISGTYKTK